MRGAVKNKIARHNLCYDDTSQQPDYENKCGTIISYQQVPWLKAFHSSLPNWCGHKAEKLKTEGNLYYDGTKCGIGYHGDSERKKLLRPDLEHQFHFIFVGTIRTQSSRKALK
jgi:hypothetical protein